MSKFGKRITAVLMSALMTVSCISTAFAEEAEKDELAVGYTGSAVVTEDGENLWWEESWVTVDELLGGVNAEDVAKIEMNFPEVGGKVGFNSTETKDWKEIELSEKNADITDFDLNNNGQGIKLAISVGEASSYTFEWTVYVPATTGDDGNASGDDGNASGDDGNASGDDGNASGDDGEATGDDADEYDVTVTIIGGDVSGIDLSIESGKYAGELEFTAQSEKAAKLFYTTDDGKTYEALAAEATDDEDTYSFAIDVDQDLEIIAVLSGDFTGDGKVNSTDAKQVQRADAEVTTADAFQKLASDVNGDGKFNSTDAKQIQRADAEVTTLGW